MPVGKNINEKQSKFSKELLHFCTVSASRHKVLKLTDGWRDSHMRDRKMDIRQRDC